MRSATERRRSASRQCSNRPHLPEPDPGRSGIEQMEPVHIPTRLWIAGLGLDFGQHLRNNFVDVPRRGLLRGDSSIIRKHFPVRTDGPKWPDYTSAEDIPGSERGVGRVREGRAGGVLASRRADRNRISEAQHGDDRLFTPVISPVLSQPS